MKRLFIVEDEAIIAMDLAEQLEEFGFEIEGIAHDGESALHQLRELNPDLILMDIVLGSGIDGIETAERLLRSRSIPVIFLTAFSDTDTVARAAKTAPYGYVTKPYNSQALRAAIEIAISKHQMEHKLLYKERWFSNILHAVHDGIIAVGVDGRIHFANTEACRLLEVHHIDELDRNVSKLLLFNAEGESLKESPVTLAMQRNAVIPITFGGSLKAPLSGNRIFIDFTAAPVRCHSNTVIGGLLALRDATQRLSVESAIRNSDGRFQSAFENSSVGIALVSFNYLCIEHNSAMARLLDLPQSGHFNIQEHLEISYYDRSKIEEGHLSLLTGQTASFQLEMKRYASHNRGKGWILLNITLLHDQDSNPSYYLYQMYDLTDRKHAEHQLYHLANYDALTGLINLPQIRSEIDRVMEFSQCDNTKVAVITLDLDHFNVINDQYGLSAGDDILAESGMRLRDIGYFNMSVGRPGGDRFVVILNDLESVNQAMFFTSRALEEIQEPFFIHGQEICLTASAGIAIGPDDGVSSDALLNAASEALKVAKINGINQGNFFNKEASAQIKGRIINEAKVVQALNSNTLQYRYLPLHQIDRTTWHPQPPKAVKLLVYWPERDLCIAPDSFIDIADYSGLTRKLSEQMLLNVCHQLQKYPSTQSRPEVLLPFYPALLRSAGAVKAFAALVHSQGVAPESFCFEISGYYLLKSNRVIELVSALREEGFSFCLNFHQGQSADADLLFTCLPRFYQLIWCSQQQPEPRYLQAISAMAHALDISVIARDQTGSVPAQVFQAADFYLAADAMGIDLTELGPDSA